VRELQKYSKKRGKHDYFDLIFLLHLLPDFEDFGIMQLLDGLREDSCYLVAYNATEVLGLPTEPIAEKFSRKNCRAEKNF
jgi:hypothetical protein